MDNIPSVKAYDATQPDYVQRLEAGIAQINQMTEGLNDQMQTTFDTFVPEFIQMLKNAGVNDIKEEEQDKKESKCDIGRCGSASILVTSAAYGLEDRRRIEDLADQYGRSCSHKVEAYQDQLKMLLRAHEDHFLAVLESSKIKPFKDLDPENKAIQVFALVGKKVHSICYEEGKGFNMYDYGPAASDMEGVLEKAKKELTRIRSNAFVAHNEARDIDYQLIMRYLLAEACKKVGQAKPRGLVKKMMDVLTTPL